MARVLITRAHPQADQTAVQVRTRGHDPLIAPLTQVEPLAEGLARAGKLADTGALMICTSARAVEVLARHGLSAWMARQRWAVVGAQAGDLLAGLGAHLAVAPQEDAARLVQVLARSTGPLVYLCAADRSSALELALAGLVAIPIYRAHAVAGFSADRVDDILHGSIQFGLVYSARSAQLLVRAIERAGLQGALTSTRWLCLSDAVARAFDADWQRAGFSGQPDLRVAPTPNAAQLLDLLP